MPHLVRPTNGGAKQAVSTLALHSVSPCVVGEDARQRHFAPIDGAWAEANGGRSAINGGTARIIPGTEIQGPNGLYQAKVEGKNAAGNWVPKTGNNGYSTFFPDNWSKERTMKEIANAYKNKTFLSGNTYEGASIGGVIKIQMFLRPDGSIISSFPNF